MAVVVSNEKQMLKSVFANTDASGNIKKRSITLRNTNIAATNDNLFELSTRIGTLVDGTLENTVKISEVELTNGAI